MSYGWQSRVAFLCMFRLVQPALKLTRTHLYWYNSLRELHESELMYAYMGCSLSS